MTTRNFSFLYQFLETAGNRALDFDAETRQRLNRLAGKTFGVNLTGAPRSVFFHITDQGVRVHENWEGKPDLVVTGSPFAFIRMVLSSNDGDVVESGIQIDGDAALAQQFAKLLKTLDIDWEEWLSQYTGDIVAHQAGNFLRDFTRWTRSVGSSFEQNVAEYLVEEAQVLASPRRVSEFIDAVDVTRADVDRLEQRLRRLGAK